ncbi:phosphatase PAP2 family protein [Dyadobacter sp. LJ53]|uniref:vanadium-dependent haloperoxidase n=1 Tax=Dyadobacter chenwenxiniae TaxID=2906456 RepID=UPI001F22B1CA|nr:vanadium-dependent haloperoxidase [Dyadobacter chenwenxiniae]MCF0049031.1 phosphatase PAP2 family protein [Dyadobacter chenwenxiniae]
MKKLRLLAILTVVSVFAACNRSNGVEPGDESGKVPHLKEYSNQVILDWNQVAFNAMGGATYQHSLVASRLNAMVHLAMHDALNAIAPAFKTYALQKRDAAADPIAAAATAAHDILLASFPDKKAMLDSALTVSLSVVKEGDKLTRGKAIGKEAAAGIIGLRKDDGELQDPIAGVEPSTVPGIFQGVPPMAFVFAPFWKTMKPFGLTKVDQFRVAPQPTLASKAYADGFEEVKKMGDLASTSRSAEQTSYAKFWYEFSEIGWNRVARTAAASRKLDLIGTARLFALLNMALADSYTAGWDSKFHYNFWRPYTAIRQAEKDGNNATSPNATWEPLLPTPPVQDYPSTHSALGNAAATVLAGILGDKVSFSMPSTTADPAKPTRSFGSFSEAAKENADSRVMAGLHFRFSCDAGLNLGSNVGSWILKNHLQPQAD